MTSPHSRSLLQTLIGASSSPSFRSSLLVRGRTPRLLRHLVSSSATHTERALACSGRFSTAWRPSPISSRFYSHLFDAFRASSASGCSDASSTQIQSDYVRSLPLKSVLYCRRSCRIPTRQTIPRNMCEGSSQETPNHALQRTAPAVTLAAPPPSPAQPSRQPPPSLSLGALGVASRIL